MDDHMRHTSCPHYHPVAATFRVHLADLAGQGEIRIEILVPSNELLFFLFFQLHFFHVFFSIFLGGRPDPQARFYKERIGPRTIHKG